MKKYNNTKADFQGVVFDFFSAHQIYFQLFFGWPSMGSSRMLKGI